LSPDRDSLNPKALATLPSLQSAHAPVAVFIAVSAQPVPLPLVSLADSLSQLIGTVAAPTLLGIDRAGWLRSVDPLPSFKEDPEQVRLKFLLSQSPPATTPLAVGRPAPDFSFKDCQGNWHSVAALRGRKNLLLTFFPRCFTGGCTTHLSSLRDSFPGFIAEDTAVWAVSVDAAGGPGGQQAFSRSLSLPFPLLPDTGRNICLLYGAVNNIQDMAQRRTILIDKDGIVRSIDSQVNPATHGPDMLALIDRLHLGR
jgi:peroxiredoxin